MEEVAAAADAVEAIATLTDEVSKWVIERPVVWGRELKENTRTSFSGRACDACDRLLGLARGGHGGAALAAGVRSALLSLLPAAPPRAFPFEAVPATLAALGAPLTASEAASAAVAALQWACRFTGTLELWLLELGGYDALDQDEVDGIRARYPDIWRANFCGLKLAAEHGCLPAVLDARALADFA